MHSGGGASACSPATSTATACSAISSARATRSPGCTASTRRSSSKARTLEEQRRLYEEQLAPIFDKPLVRWMMKQPASLYGLGIPPAQYKALAGDSPKGIGVVLSQRVERLACDFAVADNYFAWQAFGRRYAPGPNPSLPPYLQREHFDAVRSRADRVALCPAHLHRDPRATSRRRASTATCCSTRRTG